MKVLLIRSKEREFSLETNITGVYPPLGLAYIASILKNAGYDVIFWDNQILNFPKNFLQKAIKKNPPDVVLLSSTTPLWPQIITLSRLIKEVSPQIIVGVGGPHLTVYPQEALSHKDFDFGVQGEGEVTILEVLKAVRESRELDNVRGCIFRKNGKVVVNPPREAIDDLDSIPFPAIDLLPYKKYFALSVRHPFFSIITARGCPFKCKFCFQGYLGRYRIRSARNVVEEMELLVNKYQVREIIIFDETFAENKRRTLEICELIRKRKIKFRWDIRTRADLLNIEILKSLKSAGCSRINLGIESGNQETLCRMNKGITISEIVEKVNLAKKFGFELRGYFMLAYPGETYKSICQTIDFAKSLPLDWASFTITIGFPGTDIYDEALKRSYFHIDYWREYTKGNIMDKRPYFIPESLKEQDLFTLKKRAYFEFYLRPTIIWKILKDTKISDLIRNSSVFLKLLPSAYYSLTEI